MPSFYIYKRLQDGEYMGPVGYVSAESLPHAIDKSMEERRYVHGRGRFLGQYRVVGYRAVITGEDDDLWKPHVIRRIKNGGNRKRSRGTLWPDRWLHENKEGF